MSNDLLAEAFAYQQELLDKENMTNSSYEKQQQEEEPSEGPHGPNFTKYLEEINKE